MNERKKTWETTVSIFTGSYSDRGGYTTRGAG